MDGGRWQRVRAILEDALERPEEERGARIAELAGDDAGLRTEVLRLLAEDGARDGWLEPPSPPDDGTEGERGRRVGPWELRRVLATGGMGTVWLARRADDSYAKQVAVKLLKRGMDTEEVLRRFRRERQVLANLEHPGIARLIDGGATDEGLPYIVLEYVDGLPIDRWCDENALTVRERIELFLEVCEAMQHAHRNLVVHRDMKPSNVLVDAEGRPKIVDFGIAKVLDPEKEGITVDVAGGSLRFMTPEYASPEQVRGRTITTSSDIYSLGALLYVLLTGRRAHSFETRSALEIERVVCEEEPTRPSGAVERGEPADPEATPEELAARRRTTAGALTRTLRGDLDTIVLEAMRKEPRRRYPSVDHFAEDLRRYLDGEPVRARPATLSYRMTKFVRRNRVAVSAAAIVVAALIGMLVESNYRYRQVLAAQSSELEQRNRAEQLFEDLLDVSLSNVKVHSGRLLALAGGAELRNGMLVQAVSVLDKLDELDPDNLEIQKAQVEARLLLGDTQGNTLVPNLGQKQQALETYERALELAEDLYVRSPDDTAVAILYGRATGLVADWYLDEEDHENALPYYRISWEVLENVKEALPDSIEARARAANRLNRLGLVLVREGDPVGGEEAFRKQVELFDALAAEAPEDAFFDLSVANGLRAIAGARAAQGDLDAELEYHRRAIERLEVAVEKAPDNVQVVRHLADSRMYYGQSLFVQEYHTEAEPLLERALETYEELHELTPKDSSTGPQLANCYSLLGGCRRGLALSNPGDEAGEHWRAARELYARAVEVIDGLEASGALSARHADWAAGIRDLVVECDEALDVSE